MNLGNLSRLSRAKTRSISAENPTGEKGRGGMAEPGPQGPARELGVGWKCCPCKRDIQPGETYELADITGPGAIQSMWFAGKVNRDSILRIYWDDQDLPSVETPMCDFFAAPWVGFNEGGTRGPLVRVNSLPVCVNPSRGLNCFWEMPFRRRCRMTVQNGHPTEASMVFYQINYTLTDVQEDCAYFHAQFRRTNPIPYKEPYTIVDGIKGRGHYVGTSMGWGINNNGWWGEGEIKFYLDGDTDFPTICGTGTEDYFGGAYNWDSDGQYVEYSTPFMGMHQVLRPDGTYNSQHRHAMYRWHIMDPIRFEEDLRVTIQALGWRSGGRYYPGQHDICSVAFWYQTLPFAPFPEFPDRDQLEII
ncbi:MAG: glycoside hydrolase family 172 protein [Lentisphaeria bacterium]|nr:glycoside hydrolase family 172 protein [Lentisphaeria bacterium]